MIRYTGRHIFSCIRCSLRWHSSNIVWICIKPKIPDSVQLCMFSFKMQEKKKQMSNSESAFFLPCEKKRYLHVEDVRVQKLSAFAVGFSFLSFPAKSNISRVNGAITYIGHDFKIYAGNCRLCVENVFDTMKWHKNMPSQAFKWEYFRSTCWTLIGNSNGKSGIDHENNISQWCILYK